jgi:FAD/FMN-containing dehydrogenase
MNTTAIMLDGHTTDLDVTSIQGLSDAMRGPLIDGSHELYDNARRVWNGNIDRRPALIARCAGVADVQRAVVFAHDHQLSLSVRGGGHGAPGYGTNDGGMVIDLSLMKGIRVDPQTQTARAQGGALWCDFDHETQAFGLATTGGTVSNTGIGGLTLGGGLGWLHGLHGLTVDNLLAVDLVTADGRFLTADAENHPDLFWALRGGGGNFGIAVSFKYQLHPVATVLGGMKLYPLERGREVLAFYREACPGLPDSAGLAAGCLTAPDGSRVAAILPAYSGDLNEADSLLADIDKALGTPLLDAVGPMSYGARQAQLDEPNAVHGLHRYWRSAFSERLTDAFIDTLVETAADFGSPKDAYLLFYLNGAATRVASDATAFAARKPQWDFDAIGCWEDPGESEARIRWVRNAWKDLEPELEGTVYLNHVSADDQPEIVRASFGVNYPRLQRIKALYDPDNLFRHNANITPAR